MWTAIEFESVEDRVRFGDVYGQLKTLLVRQQNMCRLDLRNLK
jgi:hypothetical protein